MGTYHSQYKHGELERRGYRPIVKIVSGKVFGRLTAKRLIDMEDCVKAGYRAGFTWEKIKKYFEERTSYIPFFCVSAYEGVEYIPYIENEIVLWRTVDRDVSKPDYGLVWGNYLDHIEGLFRRTYDNMFVMTAQYKSSRISVPDVFRPLFFTEYIGGHIVEMKKLLSMEKIILRYMKLGFGWLQIRPYILYDSAAIDLFLWRPLQSNKILTPYMRNGVIYWEEEPFVSDSQITKCPSDRSWIKWILKNSGGEGIAPPKTDLLYYSFQLDRSDVYPPYVEEKAKRLGVNT